MLFGLLKNEMLSLSKFCNKNHTTCFIDSCCGYDWQICSKLHDKRYLNKRLNRIQADELLYRCFKRKVNVVFAFIGYILVRIFGGYFYKKAQRGKMTIDELEKEFIKEGHRQVKKDKLLNDHLNQIGNDVLEVKHKQDKFTYILFGVIFVAGIMIGTQYKLWTPYIKSFVNVVKTANDIKGSNL